MNRLTLRVHRHVLVVVITALVAAACGDSRPESPDAAVPETAVSPPNPARASVSGKGPSGTMVVLEPQYEHEFPPAAGLAYMDQTGLEFIPAVLAAQTGQTVQFRNNEDVLHNVRVQETGTYVPVFNVATTPHNSYTFAFEKPGYYEVSCDIHSTMRATIVVAAMPYVSIADGVGRFAFEDVVPGPYKIVWFEKGERRHKQVDLRQPGTQVALP